MSSTYSVFKEFQPTGISGSNVTPGFSPMYTLNKGHDSDNFKAKLKRELKMSNVSGMDFYKAAEKTGLEDESVGRGLRDRIQSYTNSKKDSIGVWDAIVLADEKQFKMEQEKKKLQMREQHKKL